MASKAIRHQSIEPSAPADLLAEVVIPATGLTKVEIAHRLGISRQALYNVLAKRAPVTPQIAARLGKLFGNGAGLWLRMQAEHDAWHAERDVDVSGIETLNVA